MSEIERTPCVICKGDCEIKLDDKGEVYWTTGNNPAPYPLSKAEEKREARCCDVCNTTFVIPLRLLRQRLEYRKYMNQPCESQSDADEHMSKYAKALEEDDYK